jgi:predicted nucleic acid-binding protein
MTKVVVDASVLIAVVTNESTKARLVQLTQGADLIAPHSIHWEIGNALSAMLKRDRIKFTEALQIVAAYQDIPIRFVDVELAETLTLADRLSMYAYDAYLIRCAIKYKAPLLSLDRGLLHAAQSVKVRILEVKR